MPASWDEFTVTELATVLGESRGGAEDLLGLAHDLEVKLPGTRAAFRDGTLRASKVEIIARATAVLDPAEARKAEAMVLGRAGRLTPGGLRAAIARAVMEVAPDKARKRREQAAADARVLRWEEDSGNAALTGRELPPAEALAADQRITAWARELKKAGLDGSMDELRARAYLDILLDKDSRPRQDTVGAQDAAGPPASAAPTGFAGRVNLTVPLTTLVDLADRPGEIPGIGPIDPWLARDLANAAAGHPRTTWCVTVTDEQGAPSGMAAPGPNPGATGKNRPNAANSAGRTDVIRPAGPPALQCPDSLLRSQASTARRADTAPGPCAPGPAETQICWSCSTRSPPATATTGTRPGGTIPASSSGTSLRSGTPPAPGWSAEDPQHSPILNTTSRTRPVAERVCVMAVRSVGTTIGSSRIPGGTSISFPTAPSGGPPRPDAGTPPNPPAIPSR